MSFLLTAPHSARPCDTIRAASAAPAPGSTHPTPPPPPPLLPPPPGQSLSFRASDSGATRCSSISSADTETNSGKIAVTAKTGCTPHD
jgi:hypothetical protein